MSSVKAEGQLFHRFHGTYTATVALQFKDETEARDAKKVLGTFWKFGEKHKNVLVISVDSEELKTIKTKLRGYDLQMVPCTWKHCRDHCKSAEIDGLPHSIDCGPPFTVVIPIIPVEQESLF